jgi:hypothetical protein
MICTIFGQFFRFRRLCALHQRAVSVSVVKHQHAAGDITLKRVMEKVVFFDIHSKAVGHLRDKFGSCVCEVITSLL